MPNLNRILFAGIVSLTCLAGSSVRADDTAVNPKYTNWAKFKPGSSNTIAADADAPQGKVHIEVTRTLVSVADDELVVSTKTVINIMGNDREMPAMKETIKAKEIKEDIKATGEQDVTALNKTFKCKVYEVTPKPDAEKNTKLVPGLEGRKTTVYINDDVPGGIVKLESVLKDGKTPITFVLTAMESK